MVPSRSLLVLLAFALSSAAPTFAAPLPPFDEGPSHATWSPSISTPHTDLEHSSHNHWGQGGFAEARRAISYATSFAHHHRHMDKRDLEAEAEEMIEDLYRRERTRHPQQERHPRHKKKKEAHPKHERHPHHPSHQGRTIHHHQPHPGSPAPAMGDVGAATGNGAMPTPPGGSPSPVELPHQDMPANS